MFKQFFSAMTRNALSLVGLVLAVASAVFIVALFALELWGYQGGAYLGILTYLLLPTVFVAGLVLAPLGVWRQRRRQRRTHHREAPLPVIDLNSPRTRGVILAGLVVAAFSAVILAGASYKGVQFMESTEFCANSCHSVMEPEATAHERSAHSNVACAECHVGPGADWFVKSKLSGSWQLISVAFHLYARPIGTPVTQLRPARETCERCHAPSKFTGDRLRVHTHYADDETNTALKNVLMVKIGGQRGKAASGIHWHVGEGVNVRYQSDPSREHIYAVELKAPDGSTKMFRNADAPPANATWRAMDCIDCHNRATHTYREPAQEVDAALDDGRIDTSLPFIKRESLRVLRTEYKSHDEARIGLGREIETFYRENYPDVLAQRASAVKAAGSALGDIYSWNVFPQMKVGWNTYPNHIGHQQSPGCFRCHDKKHVTGDGEKIPKDCDTCHNMIAEDEKDPAILKALQ